MATKIGDWYFEVTADSSPAIKALDTITFAAKTAAAIIAKELAQAGGEFNMSVQRSVGIFTGLTGSLADARDILRDIASTALDSPIFDADQLQRTTRMMVAYGIAADEAFELAKSLNIVSNTIEGGSRRAMDLARAIGQISAAGVLQGDEARQLNEFVDIYGLIAKETGRTRQEVKKLGEEQMLLAEDVLPILQRHLNETFGPVGQQMLGTFSTQVAGLRTVFTALGSALVEPFIGSFGGGVLTSAIADVRSALRGLVTEGEDGLFAFAGALEPLNALLRDLADEVGSVGERFAGWLGRAASGGDISGLVDFLRAAGREIRSFASGTADFLGEIGSDIGAIMPSVTQFLGVWYDYVSDVLPRLVDGVLALTDVIALIIPQITKLGELWVVAFGPPIVAALDAVVTVLEAVAYVLRAINDVMPVTVAAVGALAVAFIGLQTAANTAIYASGLSAIPLWAKAFAAQITATGAAAAAAVPRIVAFGAAAAATVAPWAAGVAAIMSWKAAIHGIRGDTEWLYKDVSLLEKPFQAIGRTVFEWFGGDKPFQVWAQEVDERSAELFATLSAGSPTMAEFTARANEMRDAIRDLAEIAPDWLREELDIEMVAINQATIDYFDTLRAKAESLLPSLSMGINSLEAFDVLLENLDMDPAVARILRELFEQKLIDDAQLAAAREAAAAVDAYADSLYRAIPTLEEFLDSAENFADKDIWQVITSSGRIIDVPAIEEASDFIDVLRTVADDAADSLERLFQADAGTTIDDFLRELPRLAEAVTDAMAEPAGALRDLNIRGALSDARAAALDVIQSLATDYGMSLQEIEDMFNERGLAGVIEALGDITKETTRTVDPLIAKYGQLGASADMIRDAIRRLNDQRTTAIRAQIDQVTAALRDAQQAAEDARKAFDDYFLGGTGGLQGAIDDLVLGIPSIGDAIEEGLLKGGPQGEAMIRQALGQAGEGLGAIFQLGLEQGLSPEEIMDLLGPVYGSIQQEVSGALNRITSLDWTEGFTPEAAAEIQDWFANILDPAQIGALFSDILGADSAVSSLQAQLDDLNAQLQVDVEFSPEQVRAAIGEIQTEIVTEPVITDEAAEAVLKEIQDIFDDDDLRVGIDGALLTGDIVDAAEAAEKQITLDFNSQLVFDPEALASMALLVGSEFADIFKQQMINTLRGDWNVSDAPGQSQTPSVQDFLERATELGIITPEQAATVTINNNFTINESESPRATASETAAAWSAASGSGGRLDPSKWYRGIMRPV